MIVLGQYYNLQMPSVKKIAKDHWISYQGIFIFWGLSSSVVPIAVFCFDKLILLFILFLGYFNRHFLPAIFLLESTEVRVHRLYLLICKLVW